MHKFSFTTVISCCFFCLILMHVHMQCVCYLYLSATVMVLIPFFPEGMLGTPDIFPLSRILGLSFDSVSNLLRCFFPPSPVLSRNLSANGPFF